MVAAQAAVSLENALLYTEISNVFEGFVKASVEAIESRDPTTSGHSRRVANYTVSLAKIVHDTHSGPFKAAVFTSDDLRELEYASLLHDFGKIGVREKVLVKAKKLYDEDLVKIRTRFDYIAKCIEAEGWAKKCDALERGASKEDVARIEQETISRRSRLEQYYATVTAANEPTVLASGEHAMLEQLAGETFQAIDGSVRTYLDEVEMDSLRIPRGSLTATEFDEIRSHVVHTVRFLSRIPWGKRFRRIPLIAGAHHERLNGTGYPKRLRGEEIPLQSKMMAVSDVYDALTASDRPYKKAVPVERALDILDISVAEGHLDGELVRIFREARVWEMPPQS
jgi:HD-GYP domain-containing protein (c-di-GMP phosphodiesterase class II)